MVNYLIECAYSNTHCKGGREYHAMVVQAAEKFWQAHGCTKQEGEKHGKLGS